MLETREPLLIRENLDAEAERHGAVVMAGEMPKSTLWVPLITGGRATGVISLENFDREHAFGEADQRLLETLAGSLSVALENARLVHETRQRNAELALINSVQEALAGELEMQAIYDVVGDKIQEIFDAQVVDIGMLTSPRMIRYPYTIERGVRFPTSRSRSTLSPATRQLLETKDPVLVNDVDTWNREHDEPMPVTQVNRRVRWSSAPADLGGRGPAAHLAPEPRPGERVHRERRPPADDPRRQPERGAGERAAGARDAAAERRAGADQQRAGGARGRARDAGDLRRRRRQDPGDLRRPGRRHRHLRLRRWIDPLPVRDRAWRPLPRRACAYRAPPSRGRSSRRRPPSLSTIAGSRNRNR